MAGRSRRKKRKIKAIIVTILIIVAAALVFGYYFVNSYIQSKLDQVERYELSTDTEEEEVVEEGYTTIALFGVDNRTSESLQSGNSDTMIVLSIDNETKECRLASVYRDTYLNVGEDKYRKCNYAYSAGGPSRTITMLNENLDLDIQDFITIDFTGLVDVVDELGGIEVDVSAEEAAEMQEYIAETANLTGKTANYVSEGTQTLDGVQACTYARIRQITGGDFSRTERQREVIEKILEKMKDASYSQLINIFDSMTENNRVLVSLSDDELKYYIKNASKFEIEDTTGFPFDYASNTIGSLGYIIIPVDLDNNVETLHEFLYPDEDDYEVSDTTESYSSQIISNLGQYTATVINSEDDEDDEDSDSSSDSDSDSTTE
ncbi:LCP family protein [Eubacterium oxidoreducens]|uniref:Transcriptional attenuator, LytR family n=1 Tax=Eubacterium oxidoreducens TaxID=1732 RepID=A0A1G6AD93_EUBOX|nr:LCP family protein [Eubacterium oxidoreducens]SDB06394.1 transcriptional attenuator, LytR family [Eubacterium oxidoreducens]